MNTEGYIAALVMRADFNPWLKTVLEYPLMIQAGLIFLAVVLLFVGPKRLKRRVTRDEIIYFFRGVQVRIHPQAEVPVISIRSGWRRYHALSTSISADKEDEERYHAVTETTTGTTSGGFTTNGTYVMPQTVVLTRYTGQYYTQVVGSRVTLSFLAVSGDEIKRTSVRFSVPARKDSKFDALWQQFNKDIAALEARFLPGA